MPSSCQPARVRVGVVRLMRRFGLSVWAPTTRGRAVAGGRARRLTAPGNQRAATDQVVATSLGRERVGLRQEAEAGRREPLSCFGAGVEGRGRGIDEGTQAVRLGVGVERVSHERDSIRGAYPCSGPYGAPLSPTVLPRVVSIEFLDRTQRIGLPTVQDGDHERFPG